MGLGSRGDVEFPVGGGVDLGHLVGGLRRVHHHSGLAGLESEWRHLQIIAILQVPMRDHPGHRVRRERPPRPRGPLGGENDLVGSKDHKWVTHVHDHRALGICVRSEHQVACALLDVLVEGQHDGHLLADVPAVDGDALLGEQHRGCHVGDRGSVTWHKKELLIAPTDPVGMSVEHNLGCGGHQQACAGDGDGAGGALQGCEELVVEDAPRVAAVLGDHQYLQHHRPVAHRRGDLMPHGGTSLPETDLVQAHIGRIHGVLQVE
mmetsp:Transcript_58253/g.127722  ORF Transcript_58253/g.127722 Transcript_58253/m.127722 type:complete len:263 (-) Transcript_58253:481-1269(-)